MPINPKINEKAGLYISEVLLYALHQSIKGY